MLTLKSQIFKFFGENFLVGVIFKVLGHISGFVSEWKLNINRLVYFFAKR